MYIFVCPSPVQRAWYVWADPNLRKTTYTQVFNTWSACPDFWPGFLALEQTAGGGGTRVGEGPRVGGGGNGGKMKENNRGNKENNTELIWKISEIPIK